jgi:hypothetical protein
MLRQFVVSVVILLLPAFGGLTQALGQNVGQVNFLEQYVDIEATGVPPDRLPIGSSAAYADAHRAAYILATRNLAELLSGLYIESSTSLQDAGAHDFVDKVKADLTRTHVQGGQVVQETSLDDFKKENAVRMTVRFSLESTIPLLMHSVAPHLREVEKSLPAAPVPDKPAQAAVVYDGLIVKVSKSFQPTIAPKLFNSKGEVVYGANSLAMDVLVSQGVAQFTNQSAKAKASLEDHGASNILTVQGVLHAGNKDVDLKDGDASMILSSSTQNSFLQKGRVFIVVGDGS